METELSDLVITPFFGILRVVDISFDNESTLCIDRNGVLYDIPSVYIFPVKLLIDNSNYNRLQKWFLLSQIGMN